jgi:pantoate--beta-alanine ligase
MERRYRLMSMTGVRNLKGFNDKVEAAARADLETHGWQVDYIEVRAARTLDIAHAGEHQLVVLAAARLGKTRLIDNIEVQR